MPSGSFCQASETTVLPDRIAKPLTFVSILTPGWVEVFSYEWIALSVLLMLLILGGLMLIYGQAREAVADQGQVPGWVSAPFAIYLGWISVASVVNFTIALQQLGIQVGQVISVDVAYVLVAAVVFITIKTAADFQDLVFLLAPIWGLVGIWVVQVRDEPDFAWAALAAAVLTALAGFARVRHRAKLHPWQVATEAAAAEATAAGAAVEAERSNAGA